MFKMKMRPPGISLGFLNKIVIDKEEGMKKIIVLILVVFLLFSFGSVIIAAPGPAPNSGDGVPEGSGLDAPFGNGPGPAPNSHDGIPDGPGW